MIPVLKTCCLCFPLKSGLLTLGYLKLVCTILIMILSAAIYGYTKETVIIVTAIFVLNTLFDIILVVAVHKERLKLFKVCYYYGMGFWVILAFLLITKLLSDDDVMLVDYCHPMPLISLIDFMPIIVSMDWIIPTCNLLFQTYFLLLIRSQMIQLYSSWSPDETKVENNTDNVTDV